MKSPKHPFPWQKRTGYALTLDVPDAFDSIESSTRVTGLSGADRLVRRVGLLMVWMVALFLSEMALILVLMFTDLDVWATPAYSTAATQPNPTVAGYLAGVLLFGPGAAALALLFLGV